MRNAHAKVCEVIRLIYSPKGYILLTLIFETDEFQFVERIYAVQVIVVYVPREHLYMLKIAFREWLQPHEILQVLPFLQELRPILFTKR